MKTYKYRLYPTVEQERLLNDCLFLCCRVYNACLERRKNEWDANQKTLSSFDQMKEVQRWVGDEPWRDRFPDAPALSIVYAQVRNEAICRLDKAFDAFFRRVKSGEKAGYPRFHPCREYDSLTYTQSGFKVVLRDGVCLKNGSECRDGGPIEGRHQSLHLSKIGVIKMRMHRPLQGKLKICTIKRTPGKEWYAMLVCETSLETLPAQEASVGIDVGIQHLIATSDGEFIGNLRPLKRSLSQLRRAQRRVSRRKKGSRRYRKAVYLAAKVHGRVFEQRKDQSHKAAHCLVRRYGLIAVESLNIAGMVKNSHLSSHIADAGWGRLLEAIEYKATQAGRLFIKVPARNTSQECSGCGEVVKKALSVREHQCPHCGLHLQRDVNAARNILMRGLRGLEARGSQPRGSRQAVCLQP